MWPFVYNRGGAVVGDRKRRKMRGTTYCRRWEEEKRAVAASHGIEGDEVTPPTLGVKGKRGKKLLSLFRNKL